MQTPDYELLSIVLAERVREPQVFYAAEVSRMVQNLGGKYVRDTVQRHLSPHGILPSSRGIDSRLFGIDRDVRLYPAAAVWQYLQSLEGKGKVDLRSNGIQTLDDAVGRELHRKLLAVNPAPVSRGRRAGTKISEESRGMSPWQEVAFKRMEE